MAVLIMDSLEAHKCDEVNRLLAANKIRCAIIPPRTTSYLQPLDVGVNGPFKNILKENWETWITDGPVSYTPSK